MSADESRPDPDALLRRVQAEGARAERAHLKVFFGYAPGVGKTYSMLEAARRAKAEGIDVVVGLVETHGRKETALLMEGIEVLPRAVVEYKGTKLTELDLDAAKSRRPQVLLVDELAHTNAPGSRHAKRWQDVLELLDAGVHVWSTLNVQHVESLNDAVAAVTHVVVRETVPDAILDRADEIELVDIPLDELFARLRDGKVYLGEAGERALESFFRRGNLLGLRELALRRTAERIDDDIRAFRDEHEVRVTWPTAPRILVLVGASPTSVQVIRAGRRMSDEADAPWLAAWVESPLTPLRDADRDRLEENLKLAERLGARIVRLSGANVAEAILDYAHGESITQVVVGRPHARFSWRDIWRGSLVQQLIRGAHDVDIRVVSAKVPLARERAAERRAGQPVRPHELLAAALLVITATVIAWLIGLSRLAETDVVLIYLAVITFSAVRFGRVASLVAAALAVGGFDFFFVPPFFTFTVADTRHVLTFGMMFVVGAFVSTLASRLKDQESEANVRERRTQSVLTLARATSAAQDPLSAATSLAEHAAGVFQRETAVLLPDETGTLGVAASIGIGALEKTERGVVAWVMQNGRIAGRGTDTLPGSLVLALPLTTPSSVEGVLVVLVRDRGDDSVLDPAQRDLADAFARQTGAAIKRLRLEEEARRSALKRRTEEMRSSLLSAVSHDLRTPLGAITGATTTLLDEEARLSDADRRALLGAVADQAFHLERLVSSLLDMTRVESGALVLRREWVPVEEVVGSAIARVRPRLGARTVATRLAPDVPLLHVDPVLFEQVLVNLLDNAAKHTPPGTRVLVDAGAAADGLEIAVSDDGPGLPPGVDVFEKFVRGPETTSGGVGLGLAICRGIVEAHGGTITAEARPEGGARFSIRLPLPPPPPKAPA